MNPLETMKTVYKRRDLAAKEWKEKGGKVVGYFCDSVPDEMILAAGFLPFRISGDPLIGTERADKYTEPVYEGFVRSMLNGLLSGHFDFLDYLIIPHSRDSIQALYAILYDVKQFEPRIEFPELYLFDTLHTRSWLAARYMYDRVCDLKKKLEEWSGKEMTNQALARAIAVGNESRTLLKAVAALRAADPPRVSGVEALQIIGSSMFMHKEDHNGLLTGFLNGSDSLPVLGGARLFVEGSPMDNSQFYEIIESCDATIVAEDNCWGNRHSDDPVSLSLDPLEAITDRYLFRSPCPRMHPIGSRVDYCLKSVVEARAQGVVFNILKWDYTQTWETPDEIRALEERGIPVLSFKNQEYLLSDPDKKEIKTQVKEFIESIKGAITR
jgi:benzoyl-CoA reductase/2-hydroxyglutaryl-CoA dehydratase subunit BcrC/BadD/HgdB